MGTLSKIIVALEAFLVELGVYAAFVTAYYFLIMHYVSGWIPKVFKENIEMYALVALGLIVAQGFVLERLTSALLWVIERIQAFIMVLHRLAKPDETISRPKEVPGLLVYRFASPLFFFNAAYFAHRVQEVIETAKSPVAFFLINSEAIVDMDETAMEAMEELYHALRNKDIVLGLCEVKGNFRRILMTTALPRQTGFKIFPSVAVAIEELRGKKSVKPRKAKK